MRGDGAAGKKVDMIERSSPVGVVGAGTMGSGIAVVAARAGFTTLLYDLDSSNLERGLGTARSFLARSAEKGKMSIEEAEAAQARLEGVTDLTELKSASVVIEGVREDLQTKQELFGQLDSIVATDTLLHTNTSTLPVTSIAAGSRHPERVVGTHYCNPAPLMRLVEVVPGRHSSTQALVASERFLTAVGKTTVLTKDRPGFILNRFLIPWENDVIRALEAGLGTVESIDRAVTGALGHPMGPFELLDIVGLDVHRDVAMRLYEQLHEPRFAPPPLVDQMISAGDLGRKTSRGFYEYQDARLFGS